MKLSFLKKNNEKSAQSKLDRGQVETMRQLKKHMTGAKKKEEVLTISATKLVVSVSSTGSELILSVTKKEEVSVL